MKRGKLQRCMSLLWFCLGHVGLTVHNDSPSIESFQRIERASQGGGEGSLVPYQNLQLFLCSPKFTFTEFPCSQKFRSLFP